MEISNKNSKKESPYSSVIDLQDIKKLYSINRAKDQPTVLGKLGPLKNVFQHFIDVEKDTKPIDSSQLKLLFDTCTNPTQTVDKLIETLDLLEPGNGQVGFQQVITLVDYLRKKIGLHLRKIKPFLNITAHDHAFGSGGDYKKTIHATTNACIIAAPLIPFCKTGTVNVTSHHGSSQTVAAIGYKNNEFNYENVNNFIERFGFAYISLASLGFPYTDQLRNARKLFWERGANAIEHKYQNEGKSWQETIKNTNAPIDIFKVVSPNAQVLNPVHHSTGVCHLNMLPYVLAIYLHLKSSGIIMHCYDGIDEISNASTDSELPNNLIIKIDQSKMIISEFSPEHIGLTRVSIHAIQEEENVVDEANTFWKIISGREKGAKHDFIVSNVAALLVAGNKIEIKDNLTTPLSIGVKMANELIASGRSYKNFQALISELNTKVL